MVRAGGDADREGEPEMNKQHQINRELYADSLMQDFPHLSRDEVLKMVELAEQFPQSPTTSVVSRRLLAVLSATVEFELETLRECRDKGRLPAIEVKPKYFSDL